MSLKFEWRPLSAGDLVEKADKFVNYPSCQRDYVWNNPMQCRLIDSVLRGLPIPPLTIIVLIDEFFGDFFQVVDGQQRAETIIRYAHDIFPTAKTFRDEPCLKPIAPGKKYSELSLKMRSQFDNYGVQCCFLHGLDKNVIETVYRRYNYQVSLNMAERLYSYSSKTREMLLPLSNHRFWSDVYLGKQDRKQTYQMLVIIGLLESYDIYCNVTTPRQLDMAAGHNTSKTIDLEVINKISSRLDLATHLFKGAAMKSVTHVIPIYQAVMLLQMDKYDLSCVSEYALARWFNRIREKSLTNRQNGNMGDLFAALSKMREQRTFWEKQLPIVQEELAIQPKDHKRRFTELDKLRAWIRQEGKCISCGKQVLLNEDGHHIEPHSIGGATRDANCLLIHKKCHQLKHKQMSSFDISTQHI